MVYEKLVGQLSVGFVASVIVTANEQELDNIALSEAVQVTVEVPSPKTAGTNDDAAGKQLTELIPLPDVAVAVGV